MKPLGIGMAGARFTADLHAVNYLTNGVLQANITPSPSVMAYAPDGAVWGDEYISEKVETKAGWQFPAPEEDWMRGDVLEVIYAGYLSAATGGRVELGRR